VHPGSSGWMPYSPNITSLPPLDGPFVRPRCVLRCRTLRGINIRDLFQCGGSEPKSSVGVSVEFGRFVMGASAALDVFFLRQQSLELGIGFLDERRLLWLDLGGGLGATASSRGR